MNNILKESIFAIDTETTGLNWQTDIVDIVSVSNGKKSIAERWNSIDKHLLFSVIENPKQLKIFKNAKFDLHMLISMGLKKFNNCIDTEILAKLYDENLSSYKLKDLAVKYINENAKETMEKLDNYMKQNKIAHYTDVPDKILKPYACKDAYYTYKLYQFYKKEGVIEKFKAAWEQEYKLLPVIIAMERRGVLINRKFLKQQSINLAESAKKQEITLKRYLGKINYNSTQQVTNKLVNKYKIILPKTEKGNYSLTKEVLDGLKHPVAKKLKVYRQSLHVKATYCDGMRELANRFDIIHCNFLQMEAVTGRFSCRQPNLQNIPRDIGHIRKAFIVRPNYYNFYFDYSQIEMRILIDYCQDESMLEALNKGIDLHMATAIKFYNKPENKITEDERFHAKTLNFGIIYGMGAKALALKFDVSKEEAKQFLNKYYMLYPVVRRFRNEVAEEIHNKGFIFTKIGRYRRLPKELDYVAINALIQGSAADVIKQAMIKIYDLIKNTKSSLLLQIHDELVIEIHKSETHLVPKIKAIMENCKDMLTVPVKVNIEYTNKNWEEAKEWKGEKHD